MCVSESKGSLSIARSILYATCRTEFLLLCYFILGYLKLRFD